MFYWQRRQSWPSLFQYSFMFIFLSPAQQISWRKLQVWFIRSRGMDTNTLTCSGCVIT